MGLTLVLQVKQDRMSAVAFWKINPNGFWLEILFKFVPRIRDMKGLDTNLILIVFPQIHRVCDCC